MSVQGVQPYGYGRAIAKSDTVNYDGTVYSSSGIFQTSGNTKPVPSDAIYVGGAGIVVAIFEDGSSAQFTCVAGQILPIRTIRVNSGTTSATLMVALYYAFP